MKDRKFTHIFFDVGGVVIIDFSGTNRWDEMLKSMGVNAENHEKFLTVWKKYKDRTSLDYDADNMADEFRSYVGLDLPPDFSFLDEFVNRFSANPSILPVLRYAKEHYKVGLITNMYPRMLDKIYTREGLMPEIEWDYIFDSSKILMKKPGEAIFKYAYKQCGKVDQEKILFIDNLEENLIAPRKLGWGTFLYDSSNPEDSSTKLLSLLKQVE